MTIIVRTRSLRGIGAPGPDGPVGPTGLQGERGPVGDAGPDGVIYNYYSQYRRNASLTVSAGWTLVTGMSQVGTDELGLGSSPVAPGNGEYLFTLYGRFDPPGGSGSGSRGLGLYLSGSSYRQTVVPVATGSLATSISTTFFASLTTGTTISIYAYGTQGSSTINDCVLVVTKVGSGPQGPQGSTGPQGNQGAQGGQGAQGAAGNSSSTWPTYNSLHA